MTNLVEALHSAQFVINSKGEKVAVQLSLQAWQQILDCLENQEDQAIVRSTQSQLAELQAGKTQGNWLDWNAVASEWYAPG
ncbi:hypothetical protein ACN4EG_22375 [Alkalinema pantanalense CENA528]|uniref:hypothetical protein n=1 Tax=Alkalinema pantanalense TaxID=1620705 RepID=UPI003D6F8F0F